MYIMTSPLSPRGQPSIVDLHADDPDTATLRPRAANADPNDPDGASEQISFAAREHHTRRETTVVSSESKRY